MFDNADRLRRFRESRTISVPSVWFRSPYDRLIRQREYLAAMLAAYDGAILGKDREECTRAWLEAAEKAVDAGWTNTPDGEVGE